LSGTEVKKIVEKFVLYLRDIHKLKMYATVLSRISCLVVRQARILWFKTDEFVRSLEQASMAIITISRGTFSGGKALAESLAKSLGYRSVDRDVIVERAAASGVSQEELRNALEKPPTWLERFQHRKYLYLTLIQAALTEEVRSGAVIYHGNAGHLLLKGAPHLMRVRIIAPLDFRVRMAQEKLRLTRAEAMGYIHKSDYDRRKWTQFLYGLDWGDPVLYDLILNLEHMRLDEACDTIAATVRAKSFALTPECRQALDDLALASQVRAELVLAGATSHLEPEVIARRGKVMIRGLAAEEDVEAAERVAAAVPGVVRVVIDSSSAADAANDESHTHAVHK
jgi:cytidylate kinase